MRCSFHIFTTSIRYKFWANLVFCVEFRVRFLSFFPEGLTILRYDFKMNDYKEKYINYIL